jgi:hypothetical protein
MYFGCKFVSFHLLKLLLHADLKTLLTSTSTTDEQMRNGKKNGTQKSEIGHKIGHRY